MEFILDIRFDDNNYNAVIHLVTTLTANSNTEAKLFVDELMEGFRRRDIIVLNGSYKRIDNDATLRERQYEYYEFCKTRVTATIDIEQFVFENPNQNKSLIDNLTERLLNGENSTAQIGNKYKIPIRVTDKVTRNPIDGEFYFMNIEHLIQKNEQIMSILDLHKYYQNENISYNEAEQLLYSLNRDKRFELFIALYDATLKNNLIIAFEVFREAYCASDNIYMQIIISKISFNLKSFLNLLQTAKIDFYDLMRKDEKVYFENLPIHFNIYRGMSELEKESNDYGISWSQSKEEAENYIYFDKNKANKGSLVSKQIYKIDILTIFSVHGKMEIVYIM
jgi:hypothetical protein